MHAALRAALFAGASIPALAISLDGSAAMILSLDGSDDKILTLGAV